MKETKKHVDMLWDNQGENNGLKKWKVVVVPVTDGIDLRAVDVNTGRHVAYLGGLYANRGFITIPGSKSALEDGGYDIRLYGDIWGGALDAVNISIQ